MQAHDVIIVPFRKNVSCSIRAIYTSRILTIICGFSKPNIRKTYRFPDQFALHLIFYLMLSDLFFICSIWLADIRVFDGSLIHNSSSLFITPLFSTCREANMQSPLCGTQMTLYASPKSAITLLTGAVASQVRLISEKKTNCFLTTRKLWLIQVKMHVAYM